MSYVVVDIAWMIVWKNHNYELVDLQLKQLVENLDTIRKTKINMCKFGSLIVCILFYVQNMFLTIGNVFWNKTKPVTQ